MPCKRLSKFTLINLLESHLRNIKMAAKKWGNVRKYNCILSSFQTITGKQLYRRKKKRVVSASDETAGIWVAHDSDVFIPFFLALQLHVMLQNQTMLMLDIST